VLCLEAEECMDDYVESYIFNDGENENPSLIIKEAVN